MHWATRAIIATFLTWLWSSKVRTWTNCYNKSVRDRREGGAKSGKKTDVAAKSNHVLELEKVGVELRDVLVVAWDGGEKRIKAGNWW